VLGWRVAVVLIGGLAAFAASAIAARTNLVISGGFHTTSGRAVVWSEQGCGYRSNGTLLYQSNPLRIDRGSAVARVKLFIRRYRGPRRYDARAPAPYGRTAVQVVTGRNAATGVASGFYIATSGTITVLRARSVGQQDRSASLSGTVHARLRLQRGSRRLRLDGSWYCRVPTVNNDG
jgi:hypothetical protein